MQLALPVHRPPTAPSVLPLPLLACLPAVQSLGSGRNGKSCRLRWFNQLDPTLKKEPFTPEEVSTEEGGGVGLGGVGRSVVQPAVPTLMKELPTSEEVGRKDRGGAPLDWRGSGAW